jgi:hypothetical protein
MYHYYAYKGILMNFLSGICEKFNGQCIDFVLIKLILVCCNSIII